MGSIKISKKTSLSGIKSTDSQNFFVDRESQSNVFKKSLMTFLKAVTI